MIVYLDTSAALAHLFAEDRVPPAELWEQPLVSSRLLEYEIWTRVHARRLLATHGEAARLLISHVAMLELAHPVLSRALEPFPTAVRTLDALHLASIEFLRARGQDVRLAAYDDRMLEAAQRLGIPLYF